MLSNPAVLTHDNSELDERAFAHAAQRGKAVPASRTWMAAGVAPSPDAARPDLLDYAAFVLEQEAEYCQQ